MSDENVKDQRNEKINGARPYVPKLFYPLAIPKEKTDKSLLTFINMLKKLITNLPFLEAVS